MIYDQLLAETYLRYLLSEAQEDSRITNSSILEKFKTLVGIFSYYINGKQAQIPVFTYMQAVQL